MACPYASSARAPVFPRCLRANEVCEDRPFSHPDKKDEDLRYMWEGFPRVLSVLSTLITQHTNAQLNTPDAAQEKTNSLGGKIFVEFPDMLGEGSSMRFLVPSLEKFLERPNFFVIGFFGFKLATSPVIPQIWALDDKLVSAIPSFDGILAYFTMRKPDGQYFNYVFLESFELVNKWRGFSTHEAATFYSPLYYSCVRINHAVLPCPIRTLIDNPAAIKRLDIVRTKYYEFRDGRMSWSAVRSHRADEVFCSITEREKPRPITFASFLGDNAFQFYSAVADYIGKSIGLPVKMIDVAALTRGSKPRPADIESISLYNIDFAFTCGITYVNCASNLVPLAAPVRVEERYQDKPVYYADLIVKADSPFYTIEDLKGATFAVNERVSLSGHLMPQYHFLQKGGLDAFFGKVYETTSHANSINHVADGQADAAAIDSVVLDMEFEQKPERQQQLRIIESTTPCTMPPFVASAWVPENLQKIVAYAITHAQDNGAMSALLSSNGFARFAPVKDADYDSVRRVRAAYNPHK